MSSTKLLFLNCPHYAQPEIDAAVESAFTHFGGVSRFVRSGDSVLLKINLVVGYKPERRVNTDPAVVDAVARAVLDAGGRPIIADSPGIGNFQRYIEKSGIGEVAARLNIPCVELDDPVALPVSEKAVFKKIEIARQALESNVVINLPKFKTHVQMGLSLAVKNLFGCVVAQRKAEWHYKAGLDRDVFAGLLLDIWTGIKPAFTLLDGVIGMDGPGPTNGKPYAYHLVAAAEDALALDFQLCRMVGLHLENFPLWRAAKARDLAECALDSAIDGDFPADFRFPDVKIPHLASMRLLPFAALSDRLGRAMTSRPVHKPALCVQCGKCATICPARAIILQADKGLPQVFFDYKKCIRCYCCHEMCPTGAIAFKDGVLMQVCKFLHLH